MPRKKTPSRNRLLPTPRIPKGLPKVELSDNSYQVLTRRYIRKGINGELVETPEEMFWRVAYHIAKVEKFWGENIQDSAIAFYNLLVSRKFFPNSPTFTGAGTPLGQLAACFVLPISDDMGRRSDGIFQTLRDAALIQQTGGGNGFSFSSIRPSGSLVKASAGKATGPVGFLRVYDNAFGEIAQGGTRRGANMAVLRVDHPDIENFIQCKTNENHITNFNISVGVTDEFMQAVENDADWDLRFPDVSDPAYKEFNGTLEDAQKVGIPIRIFKTLKARALFDLIVKQAHHNGEPGILFLDTANRFNPVPHLYPLQATNPCGEQWLGPYENCCLGSINLACYGLSDGKVNWEGLQQDIWWATRFLDDVVDANKYVPTIPQLKLRALQARRIGLGLMGLADLMVHIGIRYGSLEGQEFASQIMEFIRYHAMLSSVSLARQRGAFPTIEGSIYDPKNLTWRPPQPLVSTNMDFGRPPVDWTNVLNGIQQNGIRNAAQTTIAPTGTIGTVAGCEGYGCEPIFALAYIRHVNDNGKDLQLAYASPLFEQVLAASGFEKEKQQQIIEQVMKAGSCKQIDELSPEVKHVFVVSQDITSEEHVRMQAAMQAFVDNSLSKTINFSSEVHEEEIASVYLLAWKLGCKGITVYVTGSREKEVLETYATADQKGARDMVQTSTTNDEPVWIKESDTIQPLFWQQTKKPRPRYLPGFTYGVETPVGKTFVTVNENGDAQPFEVFINTAKAGSDVAADSEAIGRLVSYILRLSSPVEPSQRLQEVWRQLSGLGGGRPMGFGPNRVRSLPDGVAQILADYIEGRTERLNQGGTPSVKELLEGDATGELVGEKVEWDKKSEPSIMRIGDLCPECGEAAMVSEEGCRKCYACGYSEC